LITPLFYENLNGLLIDKSNVEDSLNVIEEL